MSRQREMWSAYERRWLRQQATHRRYEKIFKGGDNNDHDVVSTTADQLVETGRFTTRAAALDHLFYSPHGAAVLQRARAARKGANIGKDLSMPTRSDVLKGYVRSAGGLDGLAKRIVRDTLSAVFPEADWPGMITATA